MINYGEVVQLISESVVGVPFDCIFVFKTLQLIYMHNVATSISDAVHDPCP